jgi:predicted glycoside hydrolase/deacetylase ChbG (UPF0249 family)
MSQQLVVCADDFALNAGVSRGIAELAHQQRISATSAMVCSPHWPEHATWLRADRAQISVGLHLDLTSPWAVQAGHGRSLAGVITHSLLRLTSAATARRVIRRQLDDFEQVWQAAPGHVDGHQHIQQFPVWREALLELLQTRYPANQRPWLRVSRPWPGARGFKNGVIGALGSLAWADAARRCQFTGSTALVGIYGFDDSPGHWLRLAEDWLRVAARTTGVVLMCHPGQADAGADPDTNPGANLLDPIAAARRQEFSALSGPEWPALLRRHGLELTCAPPPRPEPVQPTP